MIQKNKFVIFVFIVVVSLSTISFSDGFLFRYKSLIPFSDYSLRSDIQRACIVYHEGQRYEELYLQLVVNSLEDEEIGWVIVLPEFPVISTLGAGNDELFRELSDIRFVIDQPTISFGFGCAASSDPGLGVSVFNTISLDTVDLTPVQATDAGDLIDWLKAQDIDFEHFDEALNTSIRDEFQWYLDDTEHNWTFIYGKFKVVPDEYGGTETVVFRFNTDFPFYPMKLTNLQQKSLLQSYLETQIWLFGDRFYNIFSYSEGEYERHPVLDTYSRRTFSFEEIKDSIDIRSLLTLNDAMDKCSFFWLDFHEEEDFEDIWFLEDE